jgi:LuxR family maltose regulon positive regulatory protein
MSGELLRTKLFVPKLRPFLVPRPYLINQLNQGIQQGCKLTLISAPAGFGKTTLLSAWIAQTDQPVAWLSLDESDSDLTRFLTYFITALQTTKSNIGQGALVALKSPGTVNIETVLTTLLNDITESPDEVTLILDDYHVIESPPIDKAIIFLLDHLPSTMHLVIAGRIDPSFPLSRLRVRRQITEIRANDLRFTLDEATVFLNQIMGFSFSAQDVAALEARTEGWIAGLQLAALSMQKSNDTQGFVRSFTGSNRYILDYLGEEVFFRQPPTVQDFLLQTSLLDRLTGALCDAVTGSRNGENMLECLERDNLFVVPLDNERYWYRYHHLFADMLRRRLHQAQPDLIPRLHCRAGAWYKRHDFLFEAVHHALSGGNFEMAADLIEDEGLRLIGQGAFITVQKWINMLPGSFVKKRPYLSVYHAWASNFTHQLDSIDSYLQDAQHALQALDLPADDNTIKDINGHIATLQAWNARRQRNNPLAIDLLQNAADCLSDGSPFVRTFSELNLGLAYMDGGELVKSAAAFRNAITQGRASENELAGLMATSHLAAVLILQGRLHEAASLCRTTIQEQLTRHEKPPPTLCMIYLRLSWVLAEWNDVDGYFENLSQGVILADQIGFDSVVTAGSISLVWEQQLLAEQGAVIELSEDVAAITDRALSNETDANGAPHSSEEDTNLATIENQHIEVYLADDSYFEIWPGYSDIAQARKLAEEGREDEALALLKQIYESAQAVEGIGLMIEARSSASLIHQSQGEINRALDALSDALDLGEPRGYIRTFVDRDAPMARLLSEAAARGIMPAYTSKLLAAFDASDQGKPSALSQPLIEPLSPREFEILQLIVQGLSNREIGERLFIALSTVKGHNQNIFGKLQVKRRTEAVARARELN